MNLLDRVRKGGTERKRGKTIGENEIAQADSILQTYKQGKLRLEERIVSNEEYYKLQYQRDRSDKKTAPTTAWLLNSVISKHADLMESYPEAICLPREKSDERDAATLSSILPVILQYNDYEKTYSDACWYFIKHGICVQGVFWDNAKENGLGDISIKNIDVLNLFWEPGIGNIQESENLFYLSLIEKKRLERLYPQLEGKDAGGSSVTVAEYTQDDTVDNSSKAIVVDWYYKKRLADGRSVLHYVKYTGNTVLFASENERGYENGFYEHGEYPFTVAVMYPEAGTPTGFGIIDICRDPQEYIDTLDGLMLDYAYKTANPRFWCKKTAGVNKKQFEDWSDSIVEVEGDIDEERLRQITLQPMGTAIQNLRQMKVDELKETSSNRDFSQGGVTGGITSGAAIATLQEAGSKTSRDMLKSMYRSYVEIIRLSIELIRQFYDEEREFRITGAPGQSEFLAYSNRGIKEQQMTSDGMISFRKPIFDIDVKAQKQSSYSKLSQNETAINLFNMGIFNPQLANQALGMLEIMDFDGIEKIKQYIKDGQTYQKTIEELSGRLSALSGAASGGGENGEAAGGENTADYSGDAANENARKLQETAYIQELYKRATGAGENDKS